MKFDAPLEPVESQRPRRCAACGTPYLSNGDDVGCPVCALRRAMPPESIVEIGPGEGRFDHYELMRRDDGTFAELGRGAMGVTYRAVDTVLGHEVALKVIDARLAARLGARARFLREARAAARLRDPHVALVFYYGMRPRDGQCFYAMELVEGETLEARVRRAGPLSAPESLEIVAQVTRALAGADVQGIVHRDLKPANLMLVSGPELNVKIIDFGLAKTAEATDEAELTHGGFVGTPAFASPEQCAGAGVDVRSDLYALGITLWVMLTGRAPFLGSPTEVLHQHRHTPLPLERLQETPQPAKMLLQSLLEKNPARRFQTPTRLLQVLPKVTAAIDAGRTLTVEGLHNLTPADVATITRTLTQPGPERISVARLPVTAREVFGREEDWGFLEAAWSNPQINVVSIVAWAGVGKSALINHWLRRMAAEHYRSAQFVFGWSFYRQGSSGGTSSADEFLDAALAWFGDADPRLGTAWEKGERLAKLMSHSRTLLVLDGLEPLQNPPGPQEGRLREPSLQALLRELAAFNTGLCVITTRIPVADIADHEGTSAPRRDLEQLSSDAGAKVLRALGVNGYEAELRSASNEFSGHCLALTLLGSYLTDAHNGDIRRRKEVSERLSQDVRQGVHARKVMESYQTWFGEGPELSVLRILGLFDRPADEKAFEVLFKPPAIRGLTESMTDLSPTEWRTILAKLRRARLISGEDPHNPGHLDTHPLVRESFGEQLRNQRTDAWKECNRRLYNYYRKLAPQIPGSFREMEPLFLAVICGCKAGLFREALHEIYIPRIQRGNASFAARVLGARGALLSVLVQFFEHGRWESPMEMSVEGQRLTAEDQLFILMQSALYLTVTRGLQTPEVQTCYGRAESLCHSLNRPRLLHVALLGQWRYSLLTDRLTATMQIANRMYSLAQEQKDSAPLIKAHLALAGTLYWAGDFEAARQNAMRGIQIWRSGGVSTPIEEVDAPPIPCLCYVALCDWNFGAITSCHATKAEAISLAKELDDRHGIAVALWHAAVLDCLARNPAEVECLTSELMELSTRQNFALWLGGGAVLRGWARSVSGSTAQGLSWIEEGLSDQWASGAILFVPFYLGLKAEALHLANRTSEALEVIHEAQALVERFEGRCCSAELHRLRGVFLAALSADESQIETSFHEAIRIAKEQKSISLAKRAEASYAEYRNQKTNASGERGFRLPLC
jgi:hypothetical protein